MSTMTETCNTCEGEYEPNDFTFETMLYSTNLEGRQLNRCMVCQDLEKIVVREGRQALARQHKWSDTFGAIFFIVLILAFGWSIIAPFFESMP